MEVCHSCSLPPLQERFADTSWSRRVILHQLRSRAPRALRHSRRSGLETVRTIRLFLSFSLFSFIFVSFAPKATRPNDSYSSRSGNLYYKQNLRRSCCPHYTLRLEASAYQSRRDQRKAINRWNNYILGPEYIRKAARLCPRTRE
jgi:hypothetical protein